MSELRQDPSSKEWVIISSERARRPQEFQRPNQPAKSSAGACVFCPGYEDRTPPEIRRYSQDGAGWTLRVVPNKFAALSQEATSIRTAETPLFRRMDGFGYHEVIIDTPHHERTLALMEAGEIKQVLLAYRSYQPIREEFQVL